MRVAVQSSKMPVNMAAGLSVNIAIERLLESEVEEISREGQEKYAPQLSMSEQLANLAHKIDFHSETKNDKDDADDENDEDQKALVTFQPSLWPWDSVRTKLRSALTEICVLSDVLNVVQEKKYVVLDPVSQGQVQPKPTLQLLARKKNLGEASNIILQGSRRMESAVQERLQQQTRPGQDAMGDFHSELINLRQRCRLKRTGNSIMGELTYRSAGSQFWNPGLFEVTKPTSTEDGEEGNKPQHEGEALEVKVSSDLDGVAEVRVQIVESGVEPPATRTGRSSVLATVSDGVPAWQAKLQASQANLFCKELFTQLCQEAYNNRGTMTNLVMGNEIRTEVFPGLDLCITYSHTKEEQTSGQDTSQAGTEESHDQPVASHVRPLEYMLHSLLRRRHKQNQSVAPCHPVTTVPVSGGNKRLRLAGPNALRPGEVTPSHESEPILDTIVKVSKHEILRTKVMEMIDSLSKEVTDPCIQCHWGSVTSDTLAPLVVHISAPELQDVGRVSTRLTVGVQDIQAVCSNCTTATFSSHIQDLKDFLLGQVSQHRILAAHATAVNLGWHVIHFSRHVPTGPVESQGHAAGLVITSPDADRSIAVRAGPSSGISVSVRRTRGTTKPLPDFLADRKWSLIGGEFVPVDWQSMPGKTFAQKFYLLLGVEMTSS